MSAIDFNCIYEGLTVGEAFRNGVQDAYYWHGHNGYTGTICEKPGYILLELDKKLSVDEAELISDELCKSYSVLTNELLELIGDNDKAKLYADFYNDKWGNAIAMQLDDNRWYFCGIASE
jgi:hypothetical protein